MHYTLWGQPTSPAFKRFADELGAALERAGFSPAAGAAEADLVVNLIDASEPKPFRRKSRGHVCRRDPRAAQRARGHSPGELPLLVRALANIVLCYVPENGVWFTTMERGHYGVEATNGEAALADGVVGRLAPSLSRGS